MEFKKINFRNITVIIKTAIPDATIASEEERATTGAKTGELARKPLK